MQLKRLIFCADDWGMSPGVNAGILELARKQLLLSVSCMANSAYLSEGLTELLSYQKDGLQFNIHFNLTYGQTGISQKELPSLSTQNGLFPGMQTLMIKSLLGQIPAEEYQRVFIHQMNILKTHNIPVTGLDGHHHIHLLPQVYKGINNLLLPNGIRYIRTMNDPQHMLSFLQTVYFKKFLFESKVGLGLMPCGYVLAKNLKSSKEIKDKMTRFGQMIVHPAKFNDFDSVGMNDKLQEDRLKELKLLLEYFS